LTKACDGGDASACFTLGAAYAGRPPFGGAAVDEVAGFRYFVKSCDLGHLPGCYRAGSEAETGRHGAASDAGQAAQFYRKGCAVSEGSVAPASVASSGQASACWRLAILYRTGRVDGPRGAADSLTRVAKEYLSGRCAASAGLDCFALGTIESSDEDPTSDLDRALAAFERACALGVTPACEQVQALAAPEE
jgi:TPR repeat protein